MADPTKIAVVILAAGMGTRMKSAWPKVMHPIGGRPMIQHLLAEIEKLAPEKVVVVVGPDMPMLERAVAPHAFVIQKERLGTAHALMQARAQVEDFPGTILVLFGDTPLLTAPTLAQLAQDRVTAGAAVAVLGFEAKNPKGYGRLVTKGNNLKEIVEEKDAGAKVREITLCNSGAMALDGKKCFGLLDQIKNNNAQKEYYLTDIVSLARDQKFKTTFAIADEAEVMGINSRNQLAQAEQIQQWRWREQAMANGATLADPATTYFSHDTQLGKDVFVGPSVVFGPGVRVADNCRIEAFCHLESAEMAEGSVIGPFARLRPGSQLGTGARVGNFCEIKKAEIGAGAKVNHLSYIGDAVVGADANIGAGTITCNYDGFHKHLTEIGAGAFVGSNTNLVAPVKVGAGAYIGSGSTITKEVAPDSLAVERAEQRSIPEWAAKYRAKNARKKAASPSRQTEGK